MYELLLTTLSISVILRGLFPVHMGHHQIFHFEVSRHFLHLSSLRIEWITFAIHWVFILIDTSGKGWWALNVFMKLRFLLLLFIFHCLYSLNLLFPIVNDYNHIRTRLIGLEDFLRVSFFALNIQLIRSPFNRWRKVLVLILWSSHTAKHFPMSVHMVILWSLFFKCWIFFRNNRVLVILKLFCYWGPFLRWVFTIIFEFRNGKHGSIRLLFGRLLSIYLNQLDHCKLTILLNDPWLFTDAHLLSELIIDRALLLELSIVIFILIWNPGGLFQNRCNWLLQVVRFINLRSCHIFCFWY